LRVFDGHSFEATRFRGPRRGQWRRREPRVQGM